MTKGKKKEKRNEVDYKEQSEEILTKDMLFIMTDDLNHFGQMNFIISLKSRSNLVFREIKRC